MRNTGVNGKSAQDVVTHIILIPIGSSGDVHPFLGLGGTLRARGHRVTVLTNPKFEPLVRKLGLDFRPLGTAEEFEQVSDDPDLWHPTRGFKTVAQWGILRPMRPVYELVKELYEPGRTVVAAQVTAIGARLAHETLGIPLATIHLQPMVFFSAYESSTMPPMLMGPWMPRVLKRFQISLVHKFVGDPVVGPDVNRFRSELGLAPQRRILGEWWHSPQRIIGLFPEWYAPLQPDWPPRTMLTGFPLWDERTTTEVPSAVQTFLEEGDAPIVFTPGSAMKHGHDFFSASAGACRRLGRRGILLTRYPDQIPPHLPPGVVHFDYIPFSRILPHAAAVVHHGGIGSTSQGLAAGVPQLIMPMAHDQPDNAARLRKLGVGRSLSPREFRERAVAKQLDALLGSSDVADRCRAIAERFVGREPLEEAAQAIEDLLGTERDRSQEAGNRVE